MSTRERLFSRKLVSALSIALAACSACSSREGEREPSNKSDTLASADKAAAGNDGTYSVFRSRHLTDGPTARRASSLIFDAASGRAILFGGIGSTGSAFDETWAYDGTWSSCPGSSCSARPPARFEAGFAYAPNLNGGVAILFGGLATGGRRFCDTWEWNGAVGTWIERSAPATCALAPGPTANRLGHAMAGFADRVVLFGGSVFDGASSPPTAELLVWDGSAWLELCDAECVQRSGTVPGARVYATLTHVVTPSKNALLLYGGRSSSTNYLGDLWEFDLTERRWSARCTPPCAAPPPRARHGAAFDPIRKKLFVHGGCPANPCPATPPPPLEYDPELDSWSPIPALISSSAPDDKELFGIAYDSKRRRIVEFGGTDGSPINLTADYYTRGGSCASDADCHTGVCAKKAPTDATGICAEPCASGAPDEGTGPCVDGFRCNKSCDQPCETCSAVPGVCTLSSGGPDDRCSGINTCSSQGACLLRNGQACSRPTDCASGTCATHGELVCSDPACGTQPCVKARSDGSCVVARRGDSFDCDGNLTCGDNGQCLTSCERDADCAPGYFCDPNKQCSIGRRFGEACTRSEECGKGSCSYGVCCAADCRNPCEKCGADGQCEFLKPEDPPRIPCGTGDCAGRCTGTSGLCDFPGATKLCERADCPEGNCRTHCLEHAYIVEWACNGSGECAERRPRACDNDFSCSDGKCNIECSSDSQCRRAATCDVTAQDCTPEGERCTDDGFQVKLKNGTIVDCKGYQCIGQGQCSEVCEDETQCAGGYRCQRNRCEPTNQSRDAGSGAPSGTGDAGVPPNNLRDAATEQAEPSRQPEPPDEGCATAPGPHDWRASALFAAGMAWLLGRRRKRRHDHEA